MNSERWGSCAFGAAHGGEPRAHRGRVSLFSPEVQPPRRRSREIKLNLKPVSLRLTAMCGAEARSRRREPESQRECYERRTDRTAAINELNPIRETIVRIVCVCSHGDQSSITLGGGEDTCQVINASLIGTLTERVRTITIRVHSVAKAVNTNVFVLSWRRSKTSEIRPERRLVKSRIGIRMTKRMCSCC